MQIADDDAIDDAIENAIDDAIDDDALGAAVVLTEERRQSGDQRHSAVFAEHRDTRLPPTQKGGK